MVTLKIIVIMRDLHGKLKKALAEILSYFILVNVMDVQFNILKTD